MMVGRLLSYWEGIFSGAMLNFGRVFDDSSPLPHLDHLFGCHHNNHGLPIRSWSKKPKVRHHQSTKGAVVGFFLGLQEMGDVDRKSLRGDVGGFLGIFGAKICMHGCILLFF